MFKSVLRRSTSFYMKEYLLQKHLTNNNFCRSFFLDIVANVKQNQMDVVSRHSSVKAASKHKNMNMSISDSRDNDNVSSDDYNIPSREIDKVRRYFQHPRNILNNVAVKVKNNTKQDMLSIPKFVMAQDRSWTCIYNINWPEPKKFIGYGPNKQLAANNCTTKILHYLLQTKKLNIKGEPLFYNKEEAQDLLKPKQIDITLPDNLIQEVRLMNEHFRNIIVPILNNASLEDTNYPQNQIEVESISVPRSKYISPSKIQNRNRVLQECAEKSYEHQSSRKLFPIYNYRNDFLKLLENNRVVVVKGEPGCGKSTQVPQYILEDLSLNGMGADCKILVTQPRRISAISLAHRISEEREERLGDSIGYQVRLKSCMPNIVGGNILFCSTGIALRRIQNDPHLGEFSHIIIDEAHERDADIDTLLLLVKQALNSNPNLKVIVMSATMDAELFSSYLNNCAILNVPGFTYPVKMNFIDDIKRSLNLNKSLRDSVLEIPIIHEDEVAKMIMWIDRNKPPGAILCFLPGWAEIKKVQNHLEDARNSSMQILIAHSKLPTDVQRKIFHIPPDHIRKVILSTNICETSITINDVGYVIDAGVHKDKNILPSGLESMQSQWISQASVNQRKGRAGRVKSGESFHLYTKARYNMMANFPVPEILRMPLEKIILDSKTYSYGVCARDYLGQLIQPPPLQRIESAVDELIQMSALDEMERLTPLGRRIALFSLPPKLSKALIHSSVFKCFNPMLTISTIYSTDIDVGFKDREETRQLKAQYDKFSDHMAMVHLYDRWEQSKSFSNSLNDDKMFHIKQLRELHATNMYSCGMLERTDYLDDDEKDFNEFAKDSELVKAVLLSGISTVCENRTHKMVKGVVRKAPHFKNKFGQIIQITSQSVLHNCISFPSPFLCYISELHSVERRRSLVSEASLLSPLAVMLFNESGINSYSDMDLNENFESDKSVQILRIVDNGIELKCDGSQIEDLITLRMAIWDTFQYFIENQGNKNANDSFSRVSHFRDNLVLLVSKLLNKMKHCN